MFKIPVLLLMKEDHNGNYLNIRQNKFPISGSFNGRLCQDMSLLGFVKFFSKFIDQ